MKRPFIGRDYFRDENAKSAAKRILSFSAARNSAEAKNTMKLYHRCEHAFTNGRTPEKEAFFDRSDRCLAMLNEDVNRSYREKCQP